MLGGDPGSMERESALLAMLVQMDGIHGKLEQVRAADPQRGPRQRGPRQRGSRQQWPGGSSGSGSSALCQAMGTTATSCAAHVCAVRCLPAALLVSHAACCPPPLRAQVLTIGATNLAEDLDQALLRPGRFEVR